MWKLACSLSLLALVGCQQGSSSALHNNLAPVAPVKTLDKSIEQTGIAEYHCKDNKIIRVVETTKTSSKSKKEQKAIRLTFEGNTQILLATITESGKKYTNINWHWFAKPNYSILATATGKVLAEQCIATNANNTK